MDQLEIAKDVERINQDYNDFE